MKKNNQEMRELVNRLREYKDILYPEEHEAAEAIESLTRRVSEMEVKVANGKRLLSEEMALKNERSAEALSLQVKIAALRAELEIIKGQVPVSATEVELFEKWARPDSVQQRKNDDGSYADNGMSAAFAGWMARSKLVAPAQAQESAQKVPEELAAIGHLIATQDNRITDQPMFLVQQKRRVYGFDPDYCDNVVWLQSEHDYEEADEQEAERLASEYHETCREPQGWVRTGYKDEWEFVTACFTEQGCKDYIDCNGHNLKEPRIYADGSYRNAEFRTLRNWLMSLAPTKENNHG